MKVGVAAGKADVERAAAALGVHPPAVDLAVARPNGVAVVHVADDSGTGEDDRAGILIRAAAARLAKDTRPGGAVAGGAAVAGGPAPGGYRYGTPGSPAFSQPALNAGGQVAFIAGTLNGPETGVYVGGPGAVQAAAVSGGAAPGGGTYFRFDVLALNAAGQVAFSAETNGGPGQGG